MTRLTNAQLQERVAELEAENARLRQTATAPLEPLTAASAPPSRAGGRLRSVFSALFIVIGVILTPVAVVGTWAQVQLVDTERFVDTFAPLADDPAVQDVVSAAASEAIAQAIDVDGMTAQVFAGLDGLELAPAARSALGLLEAPAAQGLRSLIDGTVDTVVRSEAFSTALAQALRVTHSQLLAALQGDPEAALSIGSDGTIGVELGPIVEVVRQDLVDRGIGLAALIPEVDRTVVVAQVEGLGTVRALYAVAVAAGAWLPWIALAFLAGGVLLALRRVGALIVTGIAFAVVCVVLAAGFGIGRLFFIGTVSPTYLTEAAATAIYDQIVERMASTAVAAAVLGLAVALVAWFASRSALPTRLRGFIGGGIGAVRSAAEGRGLTSGRFGEWMYRQRLLVRVVIGAVAAAVIVLGRPLTTGLIVWTVVLALLAVLVAELLQRPTASVAPAGPVGRESVPA